MAGEAPAYLTVGTAVSAKYRGAFCEARVKIINKKLVKCKIHFKDHTSAIVHDEFIKGDLKLGSTVEAKHPESAAWVEGVISKLNDASIYTVLFDDGDEKTLRRSSLCLQGEKHFHESETLDHLPLTDPENFGTPVVRDRTKRKRSHTPKPFSATRVEEEEEEESSGSEIFKRLRREEPESAIGRVVVVEMNEKRKNLSFPALIVDPSCTKVAPNKTEEHIVTRSFKDNKYYTVAESSWRSFTSKDHIYKGDNPSLKSATEKAVLYIETGQLPPTWDFSILKNKDRIEADSEETGGSSDESSDDEYDMQKDAWLASLHKFMEERGTPINKPPVLGYRDLNLYKLFKLVQDLGGCRKVTDKQQWRYIASKMGIPIHTSHSYNIKTAYNKYLFAFEDHNRKLGSSFTSSSVLSRPRRRSSYDRWTPVAAPVTTPKEEKKETVEKEKKKDDTEEQKTELKPEVPGPSETKPGPKKKTRSKADTKEPEKETMKEEEPANKKVTEPKQTPPRGTGKRASGAAKNAAKEEVVDGDEDDGPGPDYEVGERVKVQYGRGRTHKVYEAKIVAVQGRDKNARYSVHYQGWNVRYDEVVTVDRIVCSDENRREKRLARLEAQKQKRLEQQRREQERLEQERREAAERKEAAEKSKQEQDEKKERERQEKQDREKREREEKEKNDRKERKEREEAERRLKKELEERERQEKKERLEKERQEKKEREELEKQEKKERKEREDELQRLAAAEIVRKETDENNEKEEKKPTKEKKTPDEGKGKTPASKRGRPPSISPKNTARPASPRVSAAGRRSPAMSLYQTRSLRSDRSSLTESPFASGLEAVKSKVRKTSTSRTKTEDEDSGEESGIEHEDKEETALPEAQEDEDPKPLDPVREEVLAESAEDAEMPIFEEVEPNQEGDQPPQSPPKLKKEVGVEVNEVVEESKEVVAPQEEPAEPEVKKSKRKGKRAAEKDAKHEGGKKSSKRRHSKDVTKVETAAETAQVDDQVKEKGNGKSDVHKETDNAAEEETGKNVEEVEKEVPVQEDTKKKKGRKRGRKNVDEKPQGVEKKTKKTVGEGEAEGGKRSRRRKRKHDDDAGKEKQPAPAKEEAAASQEEKEKEGESVEEPKTEETKEKEESVDRERRDGDNLEASTSDKMLTANITTPPTTPESSGTGISSPNEDEGLEEENSNKMEESVQARLGNKSDSDSMAEMASSRSTASSKNEQLEEEGSSNNSTEKASEATQPKRGRPLGSTKKKRRKHSLTESKPPKSGKKSHKKGGRRRTTSISSSAKPGPSSSDTDDSCHAENKHTKAKVKKENGSSTEGSAQKPNRVPRPCKYNFTVDVSHMSNADDRIATIQKQLIELRKIYLQLKSEVSTIDRRRKRFRRKEREAQAAALMAATSLANISNSAPATSIAPSS